VTTLYVLCGLPGAVKSTWAQKNAGRLQAVVLCSDDVRRDFEAHGRDPWDGDSVFAEMELRARDLLRADRSVVLDATHYQRRYRTYIQEVVSGIDVQRVAVWFVVPLGVCLQRNARRNSLAFGNRRMPDEFVHALAEAFEPPGGDEFDEVLTVNP
jgi:predicted kinase